MNTIEIMGKYKIIEFINQIQDELKHCSKDEKYLMIVRVYSPEFITNSVVFRGKILGRVLSKKIQYLFDDIDKGKIAHCKFRVDVVR